MSAVFSNTSRVYVLTQILRHSACEKPVSNGGNDDKHLITTLHTICGQTFDLHVLAEANV